MKEQRSMISRILHRDVPIAFVLLIVVALLSSGATRPAFRSAEYKFTDASHRGLQIMPASCPSSPHYAGDCSSATPTNCDIGYSFQGSTCVFVGCPSGYSLEGTVCVQHTACMLPTTCSDSLHVLDQCTGNVTSCTGSYGPGWYCSAGSCVPPEPPTGAIIATPSLVRVDDTTTLSWNSTNTNDCTVTGSNGDGGTGWSGATGTHVSTPIQTQTTYTLSCAGQDGTTITKSVTIHIIPKFIEQ